MVGQGSEDERSALYVGLYHRGQRRRDLESEYLATYYPVDECVPRVRRLADSRLVHVTDLYTAEELMTSPAYNEMFPRSHLQNSLAVRLGASDGTYVFWAVGDPVVRDEWGSSQVRDGHQAAAARSTVRSRSAGTGPRRGAEATATCLAGEPAVGVVQVDGSRRILEVNDRARGILRDRDGLSDHGGVLRAREPGDRPLFERLLAAALPDSGAVPVGGSMALGRPSLTSRFMVNVRPVTIRQPDYGARRVAALVLIVDPQARHRIDPELVATTLGLTPSESQVAVWLAEGKSVRAMAQATGRTQNAIHWHLKHIYRKCSVSRQRT